MLSILVNCVFLAMENPGVDGVSHSSRRSPRVTALPQDSSLGRLLFVSDIVFAVIFTGEMLLKWVAMGVWSHKTAYFRNIW